MKLQLVDENGNVQHEICIDRSSSRSIRALQVRHHKWVSHNFPAQLGNVKEQEVRDLIDESPFRTPKAIAKAINEGDPRLVKRPYHGLLGAVEEMGELAHDFLKFEQGIRGSATAEGRAELRKRMQDSVADIIIFLISFCNTHGIDLESTLWDTFENEVEPRDWVKWPETGRPPEDVIVGDRPVAVAEAACAEESQDCAEADCQSEPETLSLLMTALANEISGTCTPQRLTDIARRIRSLVGQDVELSFVLE